MACNHKFVLSQTEPAHRIGLDEHGNQTTLHALKLTGKCDYCKLRAYTIVPFDTLTFLYKGEPGYMEAFQSIDAQNNNN